MQERLYDFRLKLLRGPEKGIADGAKAAEDEFLLEDGVRVVVPDTDVVMTAARDFADYMLSSMETPVLLAHKGDGGVTVTIDPSYGSYKSYRIDVNDRIRIVAHDERGAAQAMFRLEERMTLRRYPCLKKGSEEHAPLYSPRMTHSGYGLDLYPNEHLLQIARSGMDAILLFYSGINVTPRGFLDYNELICRAAKYGLDVYAYSYVGFRMHPDDPGARQLADSLYGELLRQCPGIKGFILVGETIGMPSRDPKASPRPYYNNNDEYGLPFDRVSGDMWPCLDYGKLMSLLSEVLRPIKPDVDLVFWSYNWETAPMEDRIACIEQLPTDVSLLVTFERLYRYELEGTIAHGADYTLAVPGPSEYFRTEAAAAKRRGLKLYSMTNTAGATWDMGVVPYLPMPQQWIRRYRAMAECRKKYGLCGIMESHHYGFWPSFVSRIAKAAFETEEPDYDAILRDELRATFGSNAEIVERATAKWSDGMMHYIPSNEDQGGAFRIGPAYPLNLEAERMSPLMPNQTGDFARRKYTPDNDGKSYPSMMRILPEIRSLEKMLALIWEGQDILETVSSPNEATTDLLNLGRFLVCYVTSGLNAKKWYLAATRLKTAMTAEDVQKAADECEAILDDEYANAERSIPCVIADSRLGFEPRMEYRATEDQIRWKLKQITYVKNVELQRYRRACTLTIEESVE